MPSRRTQLEEVFESVSTHLLAEHPDDERGRMLHAPALKTAGTSFAFLANDGLVVKLAATRVDELIAGGEGQPCNPGGRRPMREWVRLGELDEAACTAYLREARAFVAGRTGSGQTT